MSSILYLEWNLHGLRLRYIFLTVFQPLLPKKAKYRKPLPLPLTMSILLCKMKNRTNLLYKFCKKRLKNADFLMFLRGFCKKIENFMILVENIDRNDLHQIVSIKNPYYSKCYAYSNTKKSVFDFNHFILRYK